MTPFVDKLEFLLSEAFVSLRRNHLMTFAAVTTAAMALFLIGGLTFSYLGLAGYAATIESKFEMNVFVRDDASPEESQALGKKLSKLPGVKSVVYKTKKEVWEDFVSENPNLTKGLEIENPMPDTYTVFFSDLKLAPKAAEAAKKLPEVSPSDGIQYMGEEQALIEQLMGAIRWTGAVLGPIMLLTGGVLIYNTIRLTMVARRKEIRIMRLVGATKSTVLTPLFVEGVVQGLVGAILATGVLWLAFSLVRTLMARTMPLVEIGPFPAWKVVFLLGLVGSLYGFTCSYLAVKEPQSLQEVPR